MGAAVAHYYHSGDLYAAGRRAGIRARLQHAKCVFRPEVAYRGMADAFAGVVMLLVAAGVFAQAEHHWLYPKSDLDCHFFWLRQHYSDAGLSDFNHAGRDDHRFRQCAFYAFVEMILNWRTPPASTQPIYPSQCCKPQTWGARFRRSPAS